MKTKLLLFLAVAAASASLPALEAGASSSERRKADLKVDPTPVATAGSSTVLSYADMIEPVQKAVVSVYSTKIVRERVPMNPFLREFFGDRVPERETPLSGMGSGVVVTPDGYIITNNHVIEDADELKVLLPDEREFKASVVGADPKTDIAIIKIEAEGLPLVTLADSDLLRVGDVVFAVGNPLGVGQTVTMGVVSAKGRSIGILEDVAGYEDFIQTDAAINQGNSGGALVDARGRLVGINSAILSPNRGSIGIGFAVPVNLAANIMRSLIETGRVARGYLGVAVEPITAELAEALGLENNTRGVMVTQVTEESPAEKAGLERSDAILSVNKRPVASLQDLRLYVSQLAPGTEVAIEIIREGEPKTLTATLDALPEDGTGSNELVPGVQVTRLTTEIRQQFSIPESIDGLLVTEVDPRSPYADRFAPNMLVLEINREPVTTIASARSALRSGARNLIYVYYRGAVRAMTVVIP
jgi:serine protease Do/serine protease DegQ